MDTHDGQRVQLQEDGMEAKMLIWPCRGTFSRFVAPPSPFGGMPPSIFLWGSPDYIGKHVSQPTAVHIVATRHKPEQVFFSDCPNHMFSYKKNKGERGFETWVGTEVGQHVFQCNPAFLIKKRKNSYHIRSRDGYKSRKLLCHSHFLASILHAPRTLPGLFVWSSG